MKLSGLKVHFSGSISPKCEQAKVVYAHTLVEELVTKFAIAGSSFVIPLGKNPLAPGSKQPLIFDWTVAKTLLKLLANQKINPVGQTGPLIIAVLTDKSHSQIPNELKTVFNKLKKLKAISLEVVQPGWYSGALRRQRLAQIGDVLIGIGGGEGVEHQANEYIVRGKPVIPLDLDLGASSEDGSGGAACLFLKAMSKPSPFFKSKDKKTSTMLLDNIRCDDIKPSPRNIANQIFALITSLASPKVFYVRLLNNKLKEFASVEAFFRSTVDKFVKRQGFEFVQVDIGENEFAWMNQAIFESLHYSPVVFVDLTTLRPNCFMELGYALANKQKVIVSAREDTVIPFDANAMEAFLWNDKETVKSRLKRLETHWQRNINRPHLVPERTL